MEMRQLAQRSGRMGATTLGYWQLPKEHLLLLSTVRPMAVALSSSHKALESPFCHKELFGTDHPLKQGRHKENSKTKTLKLSKRKSKASSKTSSGTSGHTKKKGTLKPEAVSSSGTIHRTTAIAPLSSPPFTLAQVDTDSPGALRTGRTVQKQSAHSSVSTDIKTGAGIGRWKNGVSRSASMHSALSTTASHHSIRSTAGSGSLSLSKSEQKLTSSVMGAAVNVRFNKTVTNVNLPPHLRVPRRAFESSADSRGRGKPVAMSITDIAAGLGRLQYRRVIVMSGAGISTSSGIPDFRTPGTGLYDNLRQYHIPEPTAIFDVAFFSHNPRPFFTLAKALYPGRYTPNPVHRFIRLLQDKGLLLRNYTQNIDGLERLAGIRPGKLVEAHGSFTTASCTRCKAKQDPEEVKAAIFSDRIPHCKRKYCMGVVKPDIVFFGEDLPQRFHSLQLPDFSHCDLLIIMGTSLEVEPFASLVALPRFDVPRVLINREVVGPFKRSRQRLTDVIATGDLVESVRGLAEQAGWLSELKDLETEGREEERDTAQEQSHGSKENISQNVSQEGETIYEQNPELLSSEPKSDPEKDLCGTMAALTLESDDPSTWHVEEAFADLKDKKS